MKLVKKLNQIKIDIVPNKELNLFLATKDRVDYIYNTSALEGNAMTYPEVETLLDGVTVGGHKVSDEHMILNQNNSVNLLFHLIKKNKFNLSKKTICALHNKVAFEEALKWGEFRDNKVRIGGTEFIPPKFEILDEVYQENLDFINNNISDKEFHFLSNSYKFLYPCLQIFCLLSSKQKSMPQLLVLKLYKILSKNLIAHSHSLSNAKKQ